MTAYQVCLIDEPNEELLYTGDEGFVIEIDGQFEAEFPTLEEALTVAADWADCDPDDFPQDAHLDRHLRVCWTYET